MRTFYARVNNISSLVVDRFSQILHRDWTLSSVALFGVKTYRFLQRTVYFLRGDELPNTGRWERELAVAQPALSVRRYLDDITEQTLLWEQ